MSISLTKIIEAWIPEKSKVIDFGCGDGTLLQNLRDSKNIRGYGVEIDHEKIEQCLSRGIPVIDQDIDKGINDFESSDFDVAIMASSIQCLKNPHLALGRMLKLSKQCVVTLPNLGYWKCRLDLASGRMPVTPNLPSSWYETDNVHLCTIKDFEKLCFDEGFKIDKKVFLNASGEKTWLASWRPNTFASEGVYLLAKR